MAETQAAKRLREYETIFLVKPDLTDDSVDKIKERVRGIVNRDGGKLLRFTVWGKKRTMYPIAKAPRAIYVHSHYLGSPSMVAEVERNLRNFDDVTRFLSVKIADEVDPETRPVLEDVKMAGDVDEAKPVGVGEREGGFRAPSEEAPGVVVPELEDEAPEEA
ncbi:MAG: 30S ribosomal protein S6 [Myxococcaceae bacterium]